MTMLTAYPKSTLFPMPTAGLVLGHLVEEPDMDALIAYAADHARKAGYTRGPRGEWMTATPTEPRRSARA
jgi:hypothetical protein